MGGVWLEVILVTALVVVNAAFAGTEIALVTLREGQLRRLEASGGSGRKLARLARDPNRFLATVQIGITLAGFLASAAAAVSLAQPLVGPLGFLGAASEPVAIVLVTLVLSFFTLVFGELAPKRVAMQRAEGWGLVAARPLAFLATISRPAIWLLSRTSDIAVRLMGGDPSVRREEIGKEELREAVLSGAGFTHPHKKVLSGAFDVAERVLREVAVPRTQVFSVSGDLPAEEALQEMLHSGHSRAPVERDGIDDITGVVHVLDLIRARGPVKDHERPGLFLPENQSVLRGLNLMQTKRQHLAVVIDEHGGTEGIVTIEDLLEEIVGEIYDEFDTDSQGLGSSPDGSLVVPGTFPIHDLPDVEIDLPEGPYTTVGGLVLHRLTRVPVKGDSVEVPGWRIEVLDVSHHAATRVRLRPSQDKPGES